MLKFKKVSYRIDQLVGYPYNEWRWMQSGIKNRTEARKRVKHHREIDAKVNMSHRKYQIIKVTEELVE